MKPHSKDAQVSNRERGSLSDCPPKSPTDTEQPKIKHFIDQYSLNAQGGHIFWAEFQHVWEVHGSPQTWHHHGEHSYICWITAHAAVAKGPRVPLEVTTTRSGNLTKEQLDALRQALEELTASR